MMTTAPSIDTFYAGMFFRSRLEARWAIFFDLMDIPFRYEPEGYRLSDGRLYLPDFFLPECRTWVEVKPNNFDLDLDLLRQAERELPIPSQPERLHGPCVKYEDGPRMLILGSIPYLRKNDDDPGWFSPRFGRGAGDDFLTYTFGTYQKNHRPWWDMGGATRGPSTHPWLSTGESLSALVFTAYTVAAQARFEYGQTPKRPERLARQGARAVDICSSCRDAGRTVFTAC